MDWGLWASIIVGLGVAGHAVVGTVLTTRLAAPTQRLWSRFGAHERLLRLNGALLLVASALHLAISWAKAAGEPGSMFWSSILPFPFFMAVGALEWRKAAGWLHHGLMAAGWFAFAWHGSVATG